MRQLIQAVVGLRKIYGDALGDCARRRLAFKILVVVESVHNKSILKNFEIVIEHPTYSNLEFVQVQRNFSISEHPH